MKRQEAFRKIRSICSKLDACRSGRLPSGEHLDFQPTELYLFGSVLTDKATPSDVDLVLIHGTAGMEWQEFLEYEFSFLAADRLSPATKLLRWVCGRMQFVSPSSVPLSLLVWDQLTMFPGGKGIRLIWSSNETWNWQAAVEAIEKNPVPWPGPRPPDAKKRSQEAWAALSIAERAVYLLRAHGAVQCQSRLDWLQLSEQEQKSAIDTIVSDFSSHGFTLLSRNGALTTNMVFEMQDNLEHDGSESA